MVTYNYKNEKWEGDFDLKNPENKYFTHPDNLCIYQFLKIALPYGDLIEFYEQNNDLEIENFYSLLNKEIRNYVSEKIENLKLK